MFASRSPSGQPAGSAGTAPESAAGNRREAQRRVPSGPRASVPRPNSMTINPEGSHSATSTAQTRSPPASGSASPKRILHPSYGRTSPIQEMEDASQEDDIHASANAIIASGGPSRNGTKDSTRVTSPKSRFSKLSLNTSNLLAPRAPSPQKAVSPSLQHWQQLRSHVFDPNASDGGHAPHKAEKRLSGLVHKTVGRLGFRQAAVNVMGLDQRRQSMAVYLDQSSGLSAEEKEEIIRERRRFARDVRICLDACAQEDSRRRLHRSRGRLPGLTPPASASPSTTFTFHPDFSAFAPLLTELHKYLPAARSRKIWCRTVPHQSAILGELATAFLPAGAATEGERQQVLEMFGVIVRHWAAEGPEEVAERWFWLCKAVRVGERQLRARGIKLLAALMRCDPSYMAFPDLPEDAHTFVTTATALIELLFSIDTRAQEATAEYDEVMKLLTELAEGEIMVVRTESIQMYIGKDVVGTMDGALKELLWLAVAHSLGRDADLAAWLLRPDNPLIMRLVPAPLLHATPESILAIRRLSTITFLQSIGRIIAHVSDEIMERAWVAVDDLVMPNYAAIPDDTGLFDARLDLLISVMFRIQASAAITTTEAAVDPFTTPSPIAEVAKAARVELVTALAESQPTALSDRAAVAWRAAVMAQEERTVIAVLRTELLVGTQLLVKSGIDAYIERTANSASSLMSRSFLSNLRTTHPHLFYKSLFSLSACTRPDHLEGRLRTVRCLSQAVERQVYWLEADPQMVSIVLSSAPSTARTPVSAATNGDAATEAGQALLDIGIGKYVVLVEFFLALRSRHAPVERGSALRAFLDKVESRFASSLENKESPLSSLYRVLAASVLTRIRQMTRSTRRSAWMGPLLSWWQDSMAQDTRRVLEHLKSTYESLEKQQNGATDNQTASGLLKAEAAGVYPRMVTMVHVCWTSSEWELIVAAAWRGLDVVRPQAEGPSLWAFLMSKGSEVVPSFVRETITRDLESREATLRLSAIRKLEAIYRARHQLIDVESVADSAKPLFNFSHVASTAAPTEIGSPTWLPAVEMDDAALNQFGKTLPLDIRRKLLELGWSDDPTLNNVQDERSKVPISAVPVAYQDGEVVKVKQAISPVRENERRAPNERRPSTSSIGSDRSGVDRRRVIVPPVLPELLFEHGADLMNDPASDIAGSFAEFVHSMQREDAATLLRPFFDDSIEFPIRLARLNSMISPDCTPSFAYAAMNALVGHIRHHLRHDGGFAYHAACLTVASRILPHVSGLSLREIRKNRADQALLPGMVYDDGTGFRFFSAWDGPTSNIPVQTAQLGILLQLLKANPRDAYLIKRILLNLEFDASVSDLDFVRAWNAVLIQLFTIVQRTYNDRSELEHFLRITSHVLAMHAGELTVISGSLRLFMLCSARFRRLFAAVGMPTCGQSIFDVYSRGNMAMRDTIVYALRSVYRIHGDTSIYQLCVALIDHPSDVDVGALYELFSMLSIPDTQTSGMASGLRGLVDREELATRVEMLSGPELALSDIGKDRAERQATKIASVLTGSADKHVFPLPNVVRMFVTAVAVNPPARRSVAMLTVFARMVPFITDTTSRGLLDVGVQALGRLVRDQVVEADAMAAAAYATGEHGQGTDDWHAARQAYLLLVASYSDSGCSVGAPEIRLWTSVLSRVLEQPRVDPLPAEAFVRALATQHIAPQSTPRKVRLQALNTLAPIYAAHTSRIDWMPLVEVLAEVVIMSDNKDDQTLLAMIETSYVDHALRALSAPSNDPSSRSRPSALVQLVVNCVVVGGDPMRLLEDRQATPALLFDFVIPLCSHFRLARDRSQAESAFWIRVLEWTIKTSVPPSSTTLMSPVERAAVLALGAQAVRVIMVRGEKAISAVPGLWSYLANRFLELFDQSSGLSSDLYAPASVGIIQWAAWTLFEFAALYRSPLAVDLRPHMLSAIHHDNHRHGRGETSDKSQSVSHFHINPPSPDGPYDPSSSRPRFSLRIPSDSSRRQSRYGSLSPEHSFERPQPFLEAAEAVSPLQSPGSSPLTGSTRRGTRMSLAPLPTPIIGSARRSSVAPIKLSSPSHRGTASSPNDRSASPSPSPSPRPPNVGRLIAPGIRNRFPSTAPTRNILLSNSPTDLLPSPTGLGIFAAMRAHGEKGRAPEASSSADAKKGGAIVHLLGAPTQMLAAPGLPSNATGMVLQSVRIALARKRVELVMGIRIGAVEAEDDMVDTKQWSRSDAMREIDQQLTLLVDREFAGLFNVKDDNERTEASVVVDTSRLSNLFQPEDELSPKKDFPPDLVPKGYAIAEEDEGTEEGVPFLISRQ